MPVRVMLVDDHDIVRTGLKSYLETQENIEIVAEACNGKEAIDLISMAKPDVVVMDISMPDMDGLDATRKLKAMSPDLHILALTIHSDKQHFFEMLSAGASGYLTKQAAADELVSAIIAVSNGLVYLQPVLAQWLLDDYRRLQAYAPLEVRHSKIDQTKDKTLAEISSREMQVLELLAQGYTNPQIGEKLSISPKTVARHRERIMQKLNLHSCTELVKFAIRKGVITL